MRIKPSTSFPHPVLSESTGDYGDRAFRLELEVDEAPSEGGLVLKGEMKVNDSFVQALVESGQASAGLMITCPDTYFDRFKKHALGTISIDLSGGLLRGTVYVRGVVIGIQESLTLESEWIDSEFPDAARLVGAGDVIAMSEELRFEAGLEKLAPLESIFRLKKSEDTPDGIFDIDFESEAIEILASPQLYELLYNLRNTTMKDLLLSSLFLPVVMETLEVMRDESYSDRRWYGVMCSRCNAEQIDIKSADSASSAQRLLDRPLGSLRAVLDRMN